MRKLDPNGENLEGGGRIRPSSAPGGLQIDFPDATVLYVTPDWWASQGKWYLNVDVVRAPAADGAAPGAAEPAGVMGAIARGAWLPALPDGKSMGPMPSAMHDRYVDLYEKFGDAWRVSDRTSLFDYARGISTKSFTVAGWPKENPPCAVGNRKPEAPTNDVAAEAACQRISDPKTHQDCVFDVLVTGNEGFAKIHEASGKLRTEAVARLRP